MSTRYPWLSFPAAAVTSTAYFSFNVLKPPFDNLLVRQAFAAALDRKALARFAAELPSTKSARPAVTFTPPETLGRDLSGQVSLFDPVKARALLASAGYRNGETFPEVTLPYPGSGPGDPQFRLFSAASEMWRENLKVKVSVQLQAELTMPAYLRRAPSDAPSIQFLLWSPQSNDPDSFLPRVFHSFSFDNLGRFSNPDLDRIVEQARIAGEPSVRQMLYIQAEWILLEEQAAAIPAYYVSTPTTFPPSSTLSDSKGTPLSPGTPPIVRRGDLHLHTSCSDGRNTFEEMVERALQLHLDFIAVTDHAFDGASPCPGTAACDKTLCSQVIQMCRNETRLFCIAGAELSGRVHVLALGVERNIEPGQSLRVLVEEVHRQGGLAVAAHPYTSPWTYGDDELVHSGLDGMECARGTPEENKEQWEISTRFNLPCVYNSDAHYRGELGSTFNECNAPVASLADLKAALLGTKCGMPSP